MAVLIDGAVLAIPSYIIFLIFGAIAFSSATTAYGSIGSTPLALIFFGYVIAFFVAPGFYYAAMHSSTKGQTVGKMAMGIAVRDADSAGQIPFGRAYGRWAIVIPMAFTVVLALVDDLAPLWDERRQAWHDKVGRTIVVEVR